MKKQLNLSTIDDALIRTGLSQLMLAKQLGVTRAAVSKWFQGKAFPRPDKLLRLGMFFGLEFDELVESSEVAVPVVSYRKKGRRKTKDEHLDNAKEKGERLKKLVKYLPFDDLAKPPVLKNPDNEYAYVQRVAAYACKEMGLKKKRIIGFEYLIRKFNDLHAVLVPTFWGAKEHHGNALNIYLPDSMTTWVFLNLDSNTVDFKFWMAHELGHCFTPELQGESGENFADAFAQAILYPSDAASRMYEDLNEIQIVRQRVSYILKEARNHVISPYTIYKAVNAYAESENLPHVALGQQFMGAVTNFGKKYKTITKALFKGKEPTPRKYIKVVAEAFNSPFFGALQKFCKTEDGAEHFIHHILDIPLADAKALAGELRK